MIDIDTFYIAAGLLPLNVWEVQRLDLFKQELFKKIPAFIANEEFATPDPNRRSGKTTKAIMEALYSEWYGYDTVIVFDTVVEAYFAKSKLNSYKKNILSKIGPPIDWGRTSLITKSTANHYEGYKIIWDLNK